MNHIKPDYFIGAAVALVVWVLLMGLVSMCGGCGTATADPRYLSVSDPNIYGYYKQLSDYGCDETAMKNVRVGYGPDTLFDRHSKKGSYAIGFCLIKYDGYSRTYREILIDKRRWDTAKDWYWRMALIGHEAGHCVSGVADHDNAINAATGCPVSIMHSNINDFPQCFIENYKTYLTRMCLSWKGTQRQ